MTPLSGPIVKTIPLKTPSANDWVFKHRHAYPKIRDTWYAHIAAKFPRKAPPEHLVEAIIISYRKRPLDFANLVAGCKPIPDALKKAGYIKDDCPRFFKGHYTQVHNKDQVEKTVIIIVNP